MSDKPVESNEKLPSEALLSDEILTSVYLKSGSVVNFVTTSIKISEGRMTWARKNELEGPKLLYVDFNQVEAITYE